MTAQRALAGLLVAELGGREAVGVCGLLLAQMGATVVLVEPAHGGDRPRDAWRAQFAAGKLSLGFGATSMQDRALLDRLLASADVVLTSSDIDLPDLMVVGGQPANVVCDITAFGATGPRTGQPLGEYPLQALSGLVDTTGLAGEAPVPLAVPVIGYSAGTYAAAGVLAALRARRRDGLGQRVDIALFDSAFLSLNAFLAGVLTGQAGDRTRMGNRHPTVSPWNLYPTADGFVYICAGNQVQWERLCAEMKRPDVAQQFPTQGSRIAGIDAVDGAIEAWTRTLTTAACMERLVAVGVAAGPIAPMDGHPREANLEFRHMVRRLHDPVTGGELAVPASPLGLPGPAQVQPDFIPAPGADRARVETLLDGRPAAAPVRTAPAGSAERPLAGLRVVEVGQFTSAPMCARNLAHLGAEVIKIEKPGGDDQRAWVPFFGGRSETFLLNNADKSGMAVDLTQAEGRATLAALLRTADVLVENNKPGMLARFGFSPAELAALNPRLVYCGISAFGADSLYASRPGFDTVIQAMSGFMSVVHPDGEPLKSGISTADVMGAQMALVSILGALESRERTGLGQAIDLSMQDVTCWLTAPAWNAPLSAIARPALLRCADGWLLGDADAQAAAAALQAAGLEAVSLAALTRSQAEERLSAAGLPCAPVLTVQEAAVLPQTRERGVWHTLQAHGLDWPVLASPLHLQRTPPRVTRIAPEVDQDGDRIRRGLCVTATEQET